MFSIYKEQLSFESTSAIHTTIQQHQSALNTSEENTLEANHPKYCSAIQENFTAGAM